METGLGPSPEVRAAGERARRLIREACQALKRRHRRDGVRVAVAITEDEALKSAYRTAARAGDVATVDALRFSAAGVLSDYMETTMVSTLIVALLLSQREKPGMGFSDGILTALSATGRIGPVGR